VGGLTLDKARRFNSIELNSLSTMQSAHLTNFRLPFEKCSLNL